MSWVSSRVYQKATSSKGFGLFAKEPVAKGELICITTGRIMHQDDVKFFRFPYHCFQVELHLQLAPTDFNSFNGIFTTNHSCTPNAGIRNSLALVALMDIKIGEEICFDYCMTDCTFEDQPTVSMECLCGTTSCRQVITDLDWKRKDLQLKYKGYFSTYLQEIIDKP